MRLSSGKYVLKHVTRVANKNKLGNRQDFHTLVVYDSDTMYKDRKQLENINLSFKSYLLLEETDNSNWTTKAKVQIGEYVLHDIIHTLKKVKKWFTAKKNEDLFYLEDGKLTLNKELALSEKRFRKIINCGFGQVLKIIPAVITDNETRYEGALILINNEEKYFEITYGELKTLIYKLKKINLYEAGLLMCNYIGRPKDDEEEILGMNTNINNKLEYEFQRKQNKLLNKSDDELKNSLRGYFK